ncbi:MAG: tetratricopeptide repeat protein, partial [Cyanobacteria bacterium J06576_12]
MAHWPEIVDSFVDGVVYLPVARQLAEDLLQSLYDVFYEAAPSFKPSYGQIQQALKEKQSLIILNGLGLEKEEMEWLMAALPNCTFLLVSKERLYWQEGADIALTGLPLEDAIALLQQDLNRPLSATEKTAAATLHQSLSGNPLQIRRAAAQIKSNNETLDRWIDLAQAQQRKAAAANAGVSESDLKKSSLNRAVFTTANKKLSPAQKRVLALLGAMGGVALSSEQAQAISKMPEAANALNELASLQLIESTEMGYQLCGDLGEAVSQTFDLRPWLQQATDYFVGAPTGGSSANTEAMLHLLEWTQQTGQWQQSLTLAQNLDSSLAMSGQWQQWQQVLTHSLQAAQQVGNGPAEAWALHQLGTSAIALGNHTQAETWLSRAVTLREALKDFPGAAVSRHNL